MGIDFTGHGRSGDLQRGWEEGDSGLRRHMLRVYNYMAGGLLLTGVISYGGAASGIYASIATTPLFWVVLLAPFALVVLLTWHIERMSPAAAQLCFWAYAALVGLSLSGIFLVYTGESIAPCS
ncbi:Bax inhibitor-1 family protein [Paraburkholderia sp. BR10872]|uniref:Bax inhibitor-1 family protein n=1 Tax=Paraburkholderia sp. BR10872 TaxID=3236989 RepID=UPI0034D323F2